MSDLGLHLHQPEILWILLVLVPVGVYLLLVRGRERFGSLRFPDVPSLAALPRGPAVRWQPVVGALGLLGLILLTVALARPRTVLSEVERYTLGTDLVVALDVSTSMRARDIRLPQAAPQPEPSPDPLPPAAGPTMLGRLAAAKEVIEAFVRGRTRDRLGLLVFAGFPYTACPLTRDRSVLLEFLEYLHTGVIEDGTAIGDAVVAALNQLKDSAAAGKAIVLLTDGRDNASAVAPLKAARLAAHLGVRVHTILLGSQEHALVPLAPGMGGQQFKVVHLPADPELLARMSELTGGLAARATDAESLAAVFARIDEMEQTALPERVIDHREVFPHFLVPGLGLLALGLTLSHTRFRRFP